MAGPADPTDGSASAPLGSLSRLEGLCLYRRTCECEALLQLAVLGVEGVQAHHVPDAALAEIAELLCEAEHAVELARDIAARWVG